MNNTNYRYSAKGIIRYNSYDSGWVVIDCPSDIVYYYNKVCNWLSWTGRKITLPLHGSHITVIAGKYTTVNENLWGYRDGETIEFQYGSIHDNKEGYYWLPVKCVDAEDVRLHFGLTPEPKYQYHLTIGHLNTLQM